MSWDYTVYVRVAGCSMQTIANAVEKCTGTRLERGDDGKYDFDEIGPIDISLHRFGAALSISSSTGANAELGELVEEIAYALGEVIEESKARELIEQEEAECWTPGPEKRRRKKRASGEVVVTLLDAGGKELASATTSTAVFYEQQLDDGTLLETAESEDVPDLLTAKGRYFHAGRRLVCTIFQGKKRKPVNRFTYHLDEYGIIVEVEESQPPWPRS